MKNMVSRIDLVVIVIVLSTFGCQKIPGEIAPEEQPTLDLNAIQKSIVICNL